MFTINCQQHLHQSEKEQTVCETGESADRDTETTNNQPLMQEPERIIGSTDRHGQLMFLIKWHGSSCTFFGYDLKFSMWGFMFIYILLFSS